MKTPSQNKNQERKQDNFLRCCNSHYPTDEECELGNQFSLTCIDSPPDVIVSCECCREYWDRYGQGGYVPSDVPCPDDIFPQLHCMETTTGGDGF